MEKQKLTLETKLYFENGEEVGTFADFVSAITEMVMEELLGVKALQLVNYRKDKEE